MTLPQRTPFDRRSAGPRSADAAPISVLICDDHQLVTDALSLVVRSAPDMELVAEPVGRAEEAIDICRRAEPDICVMNVGLGPGLNGIEATRRIRSVSPNTIVIVLSSNNSDERVVAAIEAGAAGLVHKGEGLQAVVGAIRAAAQGESLIDHATLPGILERASNERRSRSEIESRMVNLTSREREILGLLQAGASGDEIARRLYISRRTVETHVQNLIRKLGVHSRLQAVALAAQYARLAG